MTAGVEPRQPLKGVQALRALAVGAVVVYHVWPTRLPGGYVGVDIFFVISGYLITAHLYREVVRTGKVELATFWARRIRRLLPASLLVLSVTAVATFLVLPVYAWRQILREVIASSLYVQNWMLAATSVDYLADDEALSPVTHFWSLSIEEQFYLVWPLLILLALWLTRKRLKTLTVFIAAVSIIAILSLIASVILTSQTPELAYFATYVRAWEFAVGGLIGLIATRPRDTRHAVLRVISSWTGLALMVGSAFLFSSTTPFPGIAASVPVMGAALVLAAGEAQVRLSPLPILRMRWVQWLGDHSYSIYLWHWPLIIFVPEVTGAELTFLSRLGIIAATLALAAITKRYVEDTWRKPKNPANQSLRKVYAFAGVAMSVTVLMAASGWAWTTFDAERSLDEAAQVIEATDDKSGCFGATAADPNRADVCGEVEWDHFVPASTAISEDVPAIYGEECETDARSAEVKACEFGDLDSETTVVLVGDSHAAQWFPALEEIALDRGWHLTTYFKAACSYTAAADRMTSDDYRESCTDWNRQVAQILTQGLSPDLVITSAVRSHRFTDSNSEISEEVAISGYETAWTELVQGGAVVAALVDNPQMNPEAVECVREARGDGSECGRATSAALERPDYLSPAAERVDGAHAIDLNEYMCWNDWCPQVIGGAVVYRDTSSHLTVTWVRTLTPYLERELSHFIAESGDR